MEKKVTILKSGQKFEDIVTVPKNVKVRLHTTRDSDERKFDICLALLLLTSHRPKGICDCGKNRLTWIVERTYQRNGQHYDDGDFTNYVHVKCSCGKEAGFHGPPDRIRAALYSKNREKTLAEWSGHITDLLKREMR